MNVLSLRQIYINDKYVVMHSIGTGHFGDIRIAKDVDTNELIAVKLEDKSKYNKLEKEYILYQKIANCMPNIKKNYIHLSEGPFGFPEIFGYGTVENFNFLLQELLGCNLEVMFNQCNRKFSIKCVAMIAIQALNRLEVVHICNIIYRDVKPENFVVGRLSRNVIYLVDFGLGRDIEILETTSESIVGCGRKVVGTCRYMSLAAHKGYEQREKDDLESLAYVLIYFLKGFLPWQGTKGSDVQDKYRKVYYLKKSTEITVLCKGLPLEFQQFLNYVRLLDMSEKPDYCYLRTLMETTINKRDEKCDWKFDWTDTTYDKSLTTYEDSEEVDGTEIKSADVFCISKFQQACLCCGLCKRFRKTNKPTISIKQ